MHFSSVGLFLYETMQSFGSLEDGKKNVEVRTARHVLLEFNKQMKPAELTSQSEVKRSRQSKSGLDWLSNAEWQAPSLSHLYKLSRLLALVFSKENKTSLVGISVRVLGTLEIAAVY